MSPLNRGTRYSRFSGVLDEIQPTDVSGLVQWYDASDRDWETEVDA